MPQVILYDEYQMRVFDCSIFGIKPPAIIDIDCTSLEDVYNKKIIMTGATAIANITLGEVKAELDPTTMKRIAKYNLDKDFEDLNKKIKLAKSKLNSLDEETKEKERKLHFMQEICQKIWEDDCFDEDTYMLNKNDDWEDEKWE